MNLSLPNGDMHGFTHDIRRHLGVFAAPVDDLGPATMELRKAGADIARADSHFSHTNADFSRRLPTFRHRGADIHLGGEQNAFAQRHFIARNADFHREVVDYDWEPSNFACARCHYHERASD